MYSDYVTAKYGEAPYCVEAYALKMGGDICVGVGGGTKYHIGATSLAVYEPLRDSATVSAVTVHTHRDDAVAAYFAKEISREMKCTVSVSAGIHIDCADENDLKILWQNSVSCCGELIEKIRSLTEVI